MNIVKFKKNNEPCITYKVINPNPVMEYDDYFKKYCECIEIEAMGLVPLELLDEAKECEGNVSATDLSIYLTNNIDEVKK